MRDIQHQRYEDEVTEQSDQLDHASITKAILACLERRVADAVVFQEFACEVVHECLVRAQVLRPPPVAQCVIQRLFPCPVARENTLFLPTVPDGDGVQRG